MTEADRLVEENARMMEAAKKLAVKTLAADLGVAPPDPHAMALAQAIGACMGHAGMSQRLMLMPSREAKANGIIERQAVILRSLALIMDELLSMRGDKRVIEWRPVPQNGAVASDPLVKPA